MDIPVFEQLQRKELITAEALEQVKAHEKNRPITVHWDLRMLLYFSVLLLSSGLGIILYKNIDTIGHATLVTLTGLLAGACFFYCFKKCAPFNREMVASPNVWFDYILLLGCLLMLTFIGYLQYQYHVFGMRWGLATFIPMLFLFFCTYYFDHKGVLSLAITNLGLWMGVAVEPLQMIRTAHLSDDNIIINGVILGVVLHLFTWLSGRLNIKPHFAGVYKNFGVHVLCISLICCMGTFDHFYFLWFIVLIGVVLYHIWTAFAQSSFYFLVVSVIYGYVGVSFVVVRLLALMRDGTALIYLGSLYFIGSGVGLVMLLIWFNKQLKKK